MCGILGQVRRAGASDREALAGGLACMAHRGPDDEGVWQSPDRRVVLGHRRLAIIDRSPGGHQPMVDVFASTVIVFNGEIFNYRELRDELREAGHAFRTASDTEVLLAGYREWGVDFVRHLNGQFAFALFDTARQRLVLARDRAGEKPLFYRIGDDELRFASELKGLLVAPGVARNIDPASLDCYLAMGYVPGDRCILRGINKLPPAHAMTFDIESGVSKVWRYWSLPQFDESSGADEETLLPELERVLEDAVQRQLVADVPVGVLLSGGVDSSLLTAMAVRSAPGVMTFTIRFPGFGSFDETEHARLVARHFGTTHIELEAEPTSADLLPVLARQYDEPVVDSSMIPTFLVSRLVRQHCTVALGGDGGDELFGGYDHYDRLLRLHRFVRPIPRPLRRVAAAASSALLPIGFRGRNWLGAIGADFDTDVPRFDTYFDAPVRRRLMASPHWMTPAERIRQRRVPRVADLLQRVTRMDFENLLPEDMLVKVDRASMLASLEVRAPFLDHRVIEFAFGRVPSALKSTISDRKILLKKLARRVLPPEFDSKRKQGFSIPLARWLEGGAWADAFHDVLLARDATFDRRTVTGLLTGQRRGRNNSERLFCLAFFELWRREYGATL